MPASRWTGPVLLFAVFAVMASIHLTLPADAFFSGDSGLKLIAARNAIAHPSRPFDVDLPLVNGQRVPYVDPMIALHGDHAHALQSPLFPVVTAPFIALFGLRGAYILPLLSFVALLPLLEALRRVAAPDTSPTVLAAVVVGANPIFFYALEYWEHAPAIALVAGATVAGLHAARGGADGSRWALLTGLLAASATLLRPEAAWYAAGIVTVIGVGRLPWFGAGVTAIVLPFAVANGLHSGNVLGPHASTNLASMRSEWLSHRFAFGGEWLWPASLPALIALALIATAWLLSATAVGSRMRQTLALAGAALMAVLAAQHLLPRELLWQAFPACLLAFVPRPAALTSRPLIVITLVTFAGIVLTATHDGGAQWGPRFLLIASPALLLLAAEGASVMLAEGRRNPAHAALIAVTLLASVATTRVAYRELRSTKDAYKRVVSATLANSDRGSIVTSDAWWYDQVVAALYGTRVFLYLPNRSRSDRRVMALGCADGPVHDVPDPVVSFELLRCAADSPAK